MPEPGKDEALAAPTPTHTFLFADLAGFTALTEAHGDEPAADLVGDFCAAVRAVLGDHGAAEVKQIGDALMLRADDPNEAVALGLRIVHEIGTRHGFPTVRVGMTPGRRRAWRRLVRNNGQRRSTGLGDRRRR